MLQRLEQVDTLAYGSGPGGGVAAVAGAALAGGAFGAAVLAAPAILSDAAVVARLQGAWPINLVSLMAFGASVFVLVARTVWQRRQQAAFRMPPLSDMASGDSLLLPDDALQWRRELREVDAGRRDAVLLRLLSGALARCRAEWSPQAAAAAIQEQAELTQCEIESRYSLIRYLTWAIPSIGFIGTVLGIGAAMGAMGGGGEGGGDLVQLASAALHTAFDTTLVALVLSVTVMFLMFRTQARDDALIAAASDWCLRRFVYRMHVGDDS